MENRNTRLSTSCLSIGSFLPWLILLALLLPTTALCQSTLWRSDKDGHTLYLMGSVHVLKEAHYPLAQALETAYTNSDIVVFEVDMQEMESVSTQQLFSRHGIFQDGQTLQKSLTDETFKDLQHHLNTIKLSPNLFRRMKPPLCAMTLTIMEMQRLGFDAKYGLDRYFSQKAITDGKQTAALETIEFQIKLFFEQTEKEQELFLKQTLSELSSLESIMQQMEEAWLQGDPETLDSILHKSFAEFPEFHERLLLQRNRNWVTKIKQIHGQNKATLIVVGAAHLVGKGSVKELLEKQNYHFTQL